MKAVLISIALGLLLAGCTTIQQIMPGQREAAHRAEDLRDLNLRVMRFADEYAGRLKEVLGRFQATARRPEERLAAENWKLQQAGAAYTIASGPNPVSNSLDMVVLATLSRLVLDDLWVTELYGDRARPVQEAHRKLEGGAWQLLTGVLTESQQAQFRDIIHRWRTENPNVRAVAYIHFSEFAKSIGEPRPGEAIGPGNLFAMLGLDPLTQLNPAVREITQTRELAERTIFYMQRAPILLDMQLQRITYQFAVMPETKSILADLDRASLVGTAADRFAGSLPEMMSLVESLPARVTKEREALVAQLMQALDDRRGAISSLTGELRATLEAGTETANSLQATLETFDRIAARYPPAAPASNTAEKKSRPFDITEVTQMVRELTVTTREINTLAEHMDTALPVVRTVTQETAGEFERIVNRVFMKLVVLLVIAISATLVAALVYRAAAIRMPGAKAGHKTAPEGLR